MPCPLCQGSSRKVLYMGAPGHLCEDGACRCLWGPAEWAIRLFPWNFNGEWALFVYEGAYLPALWRWLTAPPEGDE